EFNVISNHSRLLAGAALLAISGVAHAETKPAATAPVAPAAAQDTAAAAATQPDDTNRGSQLGYIVVTATRRETNLQKTPI
ncbi:hypothetical protein NZA98_26730, partial [Escherichia coli]|nr:hypothetical protein [Escherichia coli]